MSEELEPLIDWIGALQANLSPALRTRINRRLAQKLRERNVDRIRRNVQPDGSIMAPRQKPGGKKRMFQKLWRKQHLRARATPDTAEVAFRDSAVTRIALVHHEGRKDRVSRERDLRVRYPKRTLLGFSLSDEELVADEALAMISEGL